MLDKLAQAQDLARGAERLLDGIVGRDGGGAVVGAEQVPGVEAREVLQRAQELVAADCVKLRGASAIARFGRASGGHDELAAWLAGWLRRGT